MISPPVTFLLFCFPVLHPAYGVSSHRRLIMVGFDGFTWNVLNAIPGIETPTFDMIR